ncbi:hypothetical protein ACWGH8_08940 [Nonomuraea muscovyensis]|uniref:Thioesterase family protein n=1 Tax=Nonomuraea muscovyensis TaxID=1124761 RepID=A0A7X0BZH8_9ACTN|nr:hypothetical protein [Nonomuraea muscovyensis]MBB6345568.1 hypothetical protein [Nonomuraea muscovyensis]
MTTMSGALTVPAHYRGREGTANGGWVAGTVASLLPMGATVEVALRAPVPVERTLRVERAAGADGAERVRLYGGEAGGGVLAEAWEIGERPQPPPFVPAEEAEEAGRAFPGRGEHPMPGCFVCGHRAPGEGLRVHPGPTGRPGEFAALWRVHPELAEWSATLPLSHVWGALDCPTGWPHLTAGGYALLGRLTARVRRSVFTGALYVVVARQEARDGCELYASAALYETGGALVAAGRALWIEVAPPAADSGWTVSVTG